MKALVLGLYSVTPVHPGTGSEISVIDLPIQRERHTGFPVVWGQSLKGVLRGKFREEELSKGEWKSYAKEYIKAKYKDRQDIEKELQKYIKKVESNDKDKREPPLTEVIFGPSTGNAGEHAGSIAVGDAKILLFPVRSIRGVFAYVTCPLVLRRFLEDIQRAKILDGNDEVKAKHKELLEAIQNIEEVLSQDSLKALVPNIAHANVVSVGSKKTIVIEDIPLDVVNNNIDNETLQKLSEIVKLIKSIAPSDVADSIEKRLVIVSDDLFKMLVKTTTEIVTRIRINPSTGSVDTGALWYEEFLPRDTLMYSVLIASEPKVKFSTDNLKLKSSEDVTTQIREKFRKEFIQIGGDETVGKGFVKVQLYPSDSEGR